MAFEAALAAGEMVVVVLAVTSGGGWAAAGKGAGRGGAGSGEEGFFLKGAGARGSSVMDVPVTMQRRRGGNFLRGLGRGGIWSWTSL